MKVNVIIFCILFAQTSASFFDEFRGAMSSVENSFGRLINDVVTDVRDSIGCTILAVKQVLSLGGIFHESSEYDERCRGVRPTPNHIQQTNNNYLPAPPSIISTTTPKPSTKSMPEIISEQIDKSIENINKTIDIIEKGETHEKMENVSMSLQHESNRLANVSALLRRELSNLSKDVKEDLGRVETDNDNPKIQGIWNEIKALHSIELSHINTHESAKIHNILNDILSVLRGENNQNNASESLSARELNVTYTEIKDQFLKLDEEGKDLDIGEIEGTNLIAETESQLKRNDYPVTINEEAKEIMDETSRTLGFDEDLKEYDEIVSDTTEATTTAPIEVIDPFESPDYAALFDIAPKDSESRKEAVESAKNLIAQSKESDAIMESYFKQTSDTGYDVFDSPDLFYFGI